MNKSRQNPNQQTPPKKREWDNMSDAQKTVAFFASDIRREKQAAFHNDWQTAFEDFRWTL